MKPKIIFFIPAVIWLIITIILLVIPGSDIPKATIFDLVYFDKWVHIGMFGMLTFLWGYPYVHAGFVPEKACVIIAICAIFYGVLMEFIQKYFAYERTFDLLDMIADATGVLIATIWLFSRIKLRRSKNV